MKKSTPPLRRIVKSGVGDEGEWQTYDLLECGHRVEAAYDYTPMSRRCEQCLIEAKDGDNEQKKQKVQR